MLDRLLPRCSQAADAKTATIGESELARSAPVRGQWQQAPLIAVNAHRQQRQACIVSDAVSGMISKNTGLIQAWWQTAYPQPRMLPACVTAKSFFVTSPLRPARGDASVLDPTAASTASGAYIAFGLPLPVAGRAVAIMKASSFAPTSARPNNPRHGLGTRFNKMGNHPGWTASAVRVQKRASYFDSHHQRTRLDFISL